MSRSAAVWAITPRWLGPWLTYSGRWARSTTEAEPAITTAALIAARFQPFDADISKNAFSAPSTVR